MEKLAFFQETNRHCTAKKETNWFCLLDQANRWKWNYGRSIRYSWPADFYKCTDNIATPTTVLSHPLYKIILLL